MDQERITATCQTCRQVFQAGVLRSPFPPFGLLACQRHCDSCVASETARQSVLEADRVSRQRNEAKNAFWRQSCPEEFRTIEEGGKTDAERLLRDCPKAGELIGHALDGQGLIARGDSGTGKTRAMWRHLRRHHDAGRRIVALSSGAFDRQARDAAGQFRLSEWFDRLAGVDVFFLDDLGKAPWTATTVGHFFELVDERTKHGRRIFLTTNLDGLAFAAQMKLGKDISAPLFRRLRESCKTIVTS